MITKNLVMKIQNLIVNHESRPVKSNPDNVHKYIILSTTWPLEPFLVENHNFLKISLLSKIQELNIQKVSTKITLNLILTQRIFAEIFSKI